MVVAVDISVAERDYQNFIYQCFLLIAEQHPQHKFIFIFEKEHNLSINLPQNILPAFIKKTKPPLLQKILKDQKYLSILKKHSADVIVSSNIISSKVPQCLLFNKNYSIRDLKKLKVIVTTSGFSKQNIIEKYPIEKEKICVANIYADEKFHPLEFEERERIKEEYADGKEYFLFSNSIKEDNLFNLLKAFSVFKKRLKSSMQLVIASADEASEEFLKIFKTYKFKDDVKLFENFPKDQIAIVTAAAYAMIDPSTFNSFTLPPLEAMKCNLPVMINNGAAFKEYCGEAALYINPGDHKDIAEKMMLVFKDEKLRSELIEKGKEQIKKYSLNKTAEQLWESILKTTH